VEKAVQGAPGLDRLWILDGGPRIGARPSTIVDCTEASPRLVREGAIERERLAEVVPALGHAPTAIGPFRLLFVCTGNTCRSPMAEVVARDAIARRGWRHVAVRSAGVSAPAGMPASHFADAAVRDRGLDLSIHRSRPLDPELLEWADIILAMSPSHLAVIDALGGADKADLLGDFAANDEAAGIAVSDPFGGDESTYRKTLWQIERLVDRSLDRLAMIVNP
jgi:protein-tyrosine phosphatase